MNVLMLQIVFLKLKEKLIPFFHSFTCSNCFIYARVTGSRRKPENLKETHQDMRRTCSETAYRQSLKLRTEPGDETQKHHHVALSVHVAIRN